MHQGRSCTGDRGVRRAPGRRLLDDGAGVHDGDPVGDLDQQRQVVGDENDAEAELLAELVEQSAIIERCTTTSRAVVGSSRKSNLGFRHRAKAITARWRMPPLSWWG